MYLFGSTLIKKLFPHFRKPRDYDHVTNDPRVSCTSIEDKDRNISSVETYYIPCTPNREMTADEIYTVKVSHAIYDIAWSKHMSDIRFLQLNGCKVDYVLLSELREFWKTIHTSSKHNRFDFSGKEDIFDDNLNRKQDHDSLHLIFNDELLFTKFCDGYIPNKYKWDALNAKLKKTVCLEEAYVIALERFFGKLPQQNFAYHKAQRLLTTKLHPLFIADFVIENWCELYRPEINFYDLYKRRNTDQTEKK